MNELVYVINELTNRLKYKDIINSLMPCQVPLAKAAQEPNARLAVLVSRRGGKSWAALAVIVAQAVKDVCNCLFIGLTRDSAERAGWLILKRILDNNKIKYKENKSKLEIVLYNGSVISFCGVPDKKQADRLLGTYYGMAVIDEAGSYEGDLLNYLIEVVLEPSLVQQKGKLILIGTPREIYGGLFYEITALNQHKEYKTFSWKTSDNIYLKDVWLKFLKNKEKNNPEFFDIPKNRRDYLGEWCKSEEHYVYKYNILNTWTPNNPVYIMGIDIGWQDSCAWSVGAYNLYEKKLYVIDTYKKNHMLINDVANKTKEYINKYPLDNIIIDQAGGGKLIQQELINRFNLPVMTADKTLNKNHWIEIYNAEVKMNRVFILEHNKQLIEEMDNLPWKQLQSGKYIEHPDYENDLCDATSYMFRHSYHYYDRKQEEKLSFEEKWWNIQEEQYNEFNSLV